MRREILQNGCWDSTSSQSFLPLTLSESKPGLGKEGGSGLHKKESAPAVVQHSDSGLSGGGGESEGKVAIKLNPLPPLSQNSFCSSELGGGPPPPPMHSKLTDALWGRELGFLKTSPHYRCYVLYYVDVREWRWGRK